MSELQSQKRLRNLSFAYLYIYSGVGSSIVLNGEILKGSRGWAGEVGHFNIHCENNSVTTYEKVLGTGAILGELLDSLGIASGDLDSLASLINNDSSIKEHKQSELIEKTIQKYCNELFSVINVLHCVLDLDEIIIDFASDELIKKLLPRVKKNIDDLKHPVEISLPSNEQHAHIHGAALNALNLAIEHIEKREVKAKQ